VNGPIRSSVVAFPPKVSVTSSPAMPGGLPGIGADDAPRGQ
jgi:hypothetical protein